MKKEEFEALGVDAETAERCAEASKKELEGYVPKGKLEIAEQAKETLELQVKENTKQLNLLKKSAGDAEKLNQTIADLQASNKQAKADYEAKVKELQIGYAVDSALDSAKAKNKKAVKALLDMDAIEVGADGKVKGLDAQLKKLTEAEDTAFLFDTDKTPKPEDGKPKVPTDGEGKDKKDGDGNGDKKTSVGAAFAKAYNRLFAPAPSDGGKDE